MAAKDNLNSNLFGAYNVTTTPHDETYGHPTIWVLDHSGEYVGALSWANPKFSTHLEAKDEGRINDIDVIDKYQRKGIATEMWKLAEQLHKQQPWHYPKIKHSDYRTDEGDEWAHSMYERGLSAKPPYNRYDEMNEDY